MTSALCCLGFPRKTTISIHDVTHAYTPDAKVDKRRSIIYVCVRGTESLGGEQYTWLNTGLLNTYGHMNTVICSHLKRIDELEATEFVEEQ